ncbi:MAG: hypothetical protein LRY40_06450 [Shewanella fodinae]|nr:hypothetical protein [Shewanella fodinae]
MQVMLLLLATVIITAGVSFLVIRTYIFPKATHSGHTQRQKKRKSWR